MSGTLVSIALFADRGLPEFSAGIDFFLLVIARFSRYSYEGHFQNATRKRLIKAAFVSMVANFDLDSAQFFSYRAPTFRTALLINQLFAPKISAVLEPLRDNG
jgi:hypothetical protein